MDTNSQATNDLATAGFTANDAPATTAPSQDDETPSYFRRRRYKVVSVEKTEMPDRAEGSDWYRYVLSSGGPQIAGFHRGTQAEVTEYAERCAEDFNLRSETGKSSRALAYSKKK